MKKVKIVSLLALAVGLSGVMAADYPVQPANNGLAKKVIEWIFTDPGLQQNTTLEDRIEAAKAANKMSELILQSIKALGIADDGFITEDEVIKLNDYMYQHYHDQMVKLHGDDERGLETGFHRVVNDGGIQKWYIPLKRKYKKANRIADGIFHLGLYPSVNGHKILNEDGNTNVRWRLISRGLSVYLKDDLGILHWSRKAWIKDQIRKLKKEKKETLAKIRAEWNEKLSQAKDKAEYRAIKSQYRTLYRQTKNEYNKKIAELRVMLRK